MARTTHRIALGTSNRELHMNLIPPLPAPVPELGLTLDFRTAAPKGKNVFDKL
jgi:hypothetical protein